MIAVAPLKDGGKRPACLRDITDLRRKTESPGNLAAPGAFEELMDQIQLERVDRFQRDFVLNRAAVQDSMSTA